MANIFGRQVIVLLTNKSGGSVIAGDVVIIDTSNDAAFTTTTSGGVTVGVGVAQESIASNATGRVLVSGYAALVNVNASVTRGQYGKTHTVAKQATGTASRGVGTFCQWLTGGTTPTALVYPTDLLGSSLTNPMTGIGAIIQGTTAGAPAELAAPLAGKVLTGAGVTTPLVYSYPPGYEFDYVEKTSDTSVTATTEAGADTVVTAAAVSYDGSTRICIEFYSQNVVPKAAAGDSILIYLFDGSSSIGRIAWVSSQAANNQRVPVLTRRFLTPSNASHTYSIRASVSAATGTVGGGSGGAAGAMPAYIRQTKA